MVFASFEFLFLFLPVFLLVQAFLPFKNITYALFSIFFYFVGEGWFVSIVLISVGFNFALGLLIRQPTSETSRKLVLSIGVAVNLLSLFFFKYIGFFATNIVNVGPPNWVTSVHLPLGISFFTFHSISYLVDVYRRDAEPERSITNLALYILMFPQLIAGPILRYHTIAHQLRKRHVDMTHVYNGLALFSCGLGQKVLIADTLAGVADPLFARSDTLSAGTAWLASLAYSFQIYFDFSGYSNMAIGLGWLTGFHFLPNFNFPYISRSITEFWRRWHISLSRWFRDYLYIPLGGNRDGNLRTYVNLVTVFFLCGLWHGAAWTFVLWGLFHGALLIMERIGLDKQFARIPGPISHLYTLCAVVVGWVLFRASSVGEAKNLLSRMFFVSQAPSDLPVMQILSGEEMVAFLLAVLFSLPVTIRVMNLLVSVPNGPSGAHNSTALRIWTGAVMFAVVFALASVKIITGAFSPFIYFRF
jgi:alginate O-acetyltransferase complex protein AlgI